jgi:hypothetical protein
MLRLTHSQMTRSMARPLALTLSAGLAAILAIAGLAGPLVAKNDVRGRVDVNLLVGVPQGEFRDEVKETGFGAGISGTVDLGRKSPVALGASLGFMNYGSETRHEPFSSTIPDVRVEVTTSNNIVLGHAVLRLQPYAGTLRPYLDGLVGFSYLFTETKIQDEDEEEEIASSTNLDDTVLSYGVRAGATIGVYTSSLQEGSAHPYSISVDLGVTYLVGGEAGYLKKGSIRRDGGRVAYDITRSRTDLALYHLGITLSR